MTDEQYKNLCKFEENNDNLVANLISSSLTIASNLTSSILTDDPSVLTYCFFHLKNSVNSNIFDLITTSDFYIILSKFAEKNNCLKSKAIIDKIIARLKETVY